MRADDLPLLTLAEAARQIAARALSPVELVDAYLDRIARLDGQVASMICVTAERARDLARAAGDEIAARGPRSPLHGIPYSLKDVYETAGVPTTAMSRVLAGHVPTQDAECQRRLAAAGGILLGKNAAWEFAHGGPSWDILFPPARNPWNLDYSPGGSSSGSAAAVAAGLSPATLGTDTGGSIRGPAAATGIAGLKPSYGLVSRQGVLPNCYSQDHCGPMAWTVEDVAMVLQQIAGHDPRDPSSADVPIPDYVAALQGGIRGMVVGVPRGWLEQAGLSVATCQAFDDALRVLRELGATVRDVALAPLQQFNDVKKTLAVAELFAIHGPRLRAQPELFGANLRYRIIAGSLVRAEDYIRAMRQRTVLARAMHQALASVDILALPTGEPAGRLEPTPPATLFTEPSLTDPFNVSGNPALALCNGYAGNGMPFSLQLVGRLFDDATVLRAGHAYERATPWRARRPRLPAAQA